MGAGQQKLHGRADSICRKVWTSTSILCPNIRYFVAILIFVAIYAIFFEDWQNKRVFLLYIAKYTEFDLQTSIIRKNNEFVAKIANACQKN